MENPFLSIVICTYNGELFLREQLTSLFEQTYSNFEIIAIDDCSNGLHVRYFTRVRRQRKTKGIQKRS